MRVGSNTLGFYDYIVLEWRSVHAWIWDGCWFGVLFLGARSGHIMDWSIVLAGLFLVLRILLEGHKPND